jgi:PIN domain nuclease of toxin-antitoxin system
MSVPLFRQLPDHTNLSLWEVATLVSLRRLDLPPSFEHWIFQATKPGVVRIRCDHCDRLHRVEPRIAA